MQYLDTNLVELHYQMPLNEIIYDFFDALKANTKATPLWIMSSPATGPASW